MPQLLMFRTAFCLREALIMLLSPFISNYLLVRLFSETTEGGGSGQQAETSLHPYVVRMNPNTELVLSLAQTVIPFPFF